LGAALQSKLSPKFLLLIPEEGKNLPSCYPTGIAVLLNPALLQMDKSADEFTSDFQCALSDRERVFCFVKNQTE